MKLLALVVTVLLGVAPGTSFKQEPVEAIQILPILQALNALPFYDTLEEAAVHATARAYQCSHAYECGGVIAQRPDGKYVVGPVYSSYSGDGVQTPHRVPLDWKLVAAYHTHPCLPQHHDVPYFSPQDLANALSDHLISFMGDLCTGNVHVFQPGRDAPDNEQPPNDPGTYLTQGRIIGHIVVDGLDQEPNTGI